MLLATMDYSEDVLTTNCMKYVKRCQFIKPVRLKWARHVAQMQESEPVRKFCRIQVGKEKDSTLMKQTIKMD